MIAIFLDIDECSDDDLHICEQLCNNTHGSHNCLCYDGYELNIDGFSCTGEEPLMLTFMQSYDKNYKI